MTFERDTLDGVPGGAFALLEYIAEAVGLIFQSPGAEAAGDLERMRQRSMMRTRSTLPDLSDVREMLRRSLVTQEEVENVLARYGYSPRAVGPLMLIASTLLGATEIIELRRRGTITTDDARVQLLALGYDPLRVDQLLTLQEYIPSAQDVIQFAVREAYTPEIAERFGQYQDFPTAALEDFGRAGLSPETAKKYWAAHWGLPSVTLAFEMYHRRGETGMTLDDLQLLLRSQDIMPFWRDKIIAVSTAPYTRVDVRRMHKVGVLTDADLPGAYRDLGYNDDRASKLAEFTIALNKGEQDPDLDPWRANLKSRAVSMYQRGALSEEEVADALEPLGYSPESIQAFVHEAELTRLNALYEHARDLVGKLYVKGHIDEAETRKRLEGYGFAEREIADAFVLWDLQRELREPTEDEHRERDLTKAEIIDAYRAQLLPESDASTMLARLGYDATEVELLLHRARLAQAKQDRADAESSLHLLYVNGRIDQADVRGKLGALSVSAERVEALLYRWNDEIASKTPHLTVAQIQRAYARGLFKREEAALRLDALGYSPEDRDVLIALSSAPETGTGT